MRVKIVTSALLSQIRFIKRILTVDILLVSYIPIQRLDNNLTSVQKRFEKFSKCLFHGRGQLSSAKKNVPMQKEGNRCWCSQGKKMGKIWSLEIEIFLIKIVIK